MSASTRSSEPSQRAAHAAAELAAAAACAGCTVRGRANSHVPARAVRGCSLPPLPAFPHPRGRGHDEVV